MTESVSKLNISITFTNNHDSVKETPYLALFHANSSRHFPNTTIITYFILEILFYFVKLMLLVKSTVKYSTTTMQCCTCAALMRISTSGTQAFKEITTLNCVPPILFASIHHVSH